MSTPGVDHSHRKAKNKKGAEALEGAPLRAGVHHLRSRPQPPGASQTVREEKKAGRPEAAEERI